MDKTAIYKQGASVAIILRLRNVDESKPIKIDDYEVEAILFTRLVGNKIKLSSTNRDEILLEKIDSATLGANITSEFTRKIPPGDCSIQLIITHRDTGAKIVETRKIFVVEYSLNQ